MKTIWRSVLVVILAFAATVCSVGPAVAADSQSSQPKATSDTDKRAEALKKYLEAQKLEQTGDYPGAVTAYKQAIDLDPTSADLRVALASLYLRNRNTIEAEIQAREAVKIAPESEEVKKLIARVYISQSFVGNAVDKDKAKAAIKELEEVVKKNAAAQIEAPDGEQMPILAVVGELYLSLDDNEKALESFKRLSEGDSGSDRAYFRLAQLYFSKNKFRESAAAARKAYDANQKIPQYGALLAKSLIRIGRAQEAIDIYKKILGLNEKPGQAGKELMLSSPLLFDYAEALVFAGKYDDAITLLEPMTKLSNREGGVYLRAVELTVEALRRSGKRDAAVRTIEDAIKGQDVSDSLPLLYALAETFEEMQQFDKAVETYEEALRAIVNPDGSVGDREQDRQNAGLILRRIGLAHRTGGNREKTMDTIERMRKVLGPKSPVPDQILIGLLLDEGKYKEALGAATAAVERHPDERSFKFYRAQAAGRLESMADAESTLKGLLKGGAEDVEVYLFMSTVQLDANQLRQAEDSARKAASLDPGDILPLITLSTIQERQKKYKDSEVTLRKALEIDPDNATVLNNLGYFLADRGERLSEAEDLIRRAVNIDPTNGSFLDSLGWLYFRQGKLQDAQKYLEQAIIYSPRSVTIHDHLGDVYKKVGQTDKARTAWETALKLGTEGKFSTEPDEINRIKEKLGQKR